MTVTDLPQLSRDLRKAAATLGADEARFLVDLYYQLQEFRKSGHNQVRSLTASEEPHDTLEFFAGSFDMLEGQIKGALDVYSAAQPLGEWARSVHGIGPVITAGLLAHIDFSRVRTAGQIWRFAGLDNPANYEWKKGQKRPWNASLKTLCWKIGDSFVKFSNAPECFYGRIYAERKAYELERDARGGNAGAANLTLQRNPSHKQRATYATGHLPAGRLDLRARRYATKLFLAHFFDVGYELHNGTPPPLPYPIAHLGHAHVIPAPAVGAERTGTLERAVDVESTEVDERAERSESTECVERAVLVESTEHHERADVMESTVIVERAGASESAEVRERADRQESTAGNERPVAA